ncbi:MAG: serine/threonine protein kinase [Alphaproteobacteria bacterium]|nr:serine/threonine protein kinase [Alphaproteobacteria bacterium]
MPESSPVVMSWQLPVRRPIAAVWAAVSDTDRFNRALGLGIEFTENVLPDGSIERRAVLRRFGLKVTWEEQPFHFCAPQWLQHERIYDNGPVARSTVEVRLEGTPDGTMLHYTLSLVPRMGLLRPVVAAEAKLTTRPQVDRALTEMVALLEGRPNTYDAPPDPLADEAHTLLENGLREVRPEALSKALLRHIEHAPLAEQARLRPLAFARSLQIPEDDAIRGFLDGVRNGVLELSWELLCPSCLAPKAGQAKLDIRPNDVHCRSCNIRYDGSFPDSVDVVFRPARHLREVEVAVACLLSPGRTPHVLVQEPIEPRQTVEWLLDLAVGGYRLATELGTASVEVRPGIRADRITVDLTDQGIQPAVLRVGPGRVRVVIRNRTRRLVAHLEKSYRPRDTLTAGRLFELPDSRDLLPPDAVAPGLHVAVKAGWVVAMTHVIASGGQTSAIWDEPSGVIGNGTWLRVYDDPVAALATVESYDGDPDVAVGLARGPVVWLEQGDESMPTGSTVDAALEIMRSVGGGHVAAALDAMQALAPLLEGRATHKPGVVGAYALLRFHSAADRHAEAVKAQQASSEPAPEVLDGYRVRGELGRGGMGRVLDAVAPDGRPVVLKVLLPEFARDPDHLQRFYNEAYVTSSLEHPNIVRVFDYGITHDGQTYMVMEKLEGHELDAFVKAGVMSAARVQHVGVRILDALQAAHEAGIVHRDVKPANVFVLEDGEVKVIDFGIAHPMEKDDELAERGVIMGSPRYMSPEQVARDPLDGRTDLYSAALVLYECLTGEVPFEGESVYALAMARLDHPPKPLSETSPNPLPDGFEGVIMRALEVDPPRRFETAAAMADALAAVECEPIEG